VTSLGNVFHFGDAGFFGSSTARRAKNPIVAFAPAPDGGGYYLLTTRGNVYNHGDAHFFGSAAASHLRAPVVSMALYEKGLGPEARRGARGGRGRVPPAAPCLRGERQHRDLARTLPLLSSPAPLRRHGRHAVGRATAADASPTAAAERTGR
jgi:hypothetical protein